MRTRLRQLCVLVGVAGAAACSSKGNRSDAGTSPGDGGGGSDVLVSSNDGGGGDDAASSSNDSGTDAGTKQPVPVQAGTCPTELDDPAGKISNQESWRFQPDKQYKVAVWLRVASLPSVAACAGDAARDARCAERDDALVTRQQLNVQELKCVVAALGTRVDGMSTLWYELPYHLTAGTPVPIGLAFGLSLTPAQIDALARHPFVEKIEPWPGFAIAQNVPAAPPPGECPAQVDAAAAKLERATSIQGKGSQPVVIELRDDGLLPAPSASIDRLWERTILNTRHVTCVQSSIDAVVAADSLPVAFSSGTGDPGAPHLPPASQAAATLKAFGRGLTWEEASAVAGSPLVESIWTSSGIQFVRPEPGCPLDLTAPLPMVTCTDDRQPIAGKITDADRTRFETTSGPMTVIIGAAGGTKVCPLPECSTHPCAERDNVINRMLAENLASQRCVRDLVTSIGGTVDATSLWLVNAFAAMLTWEQIQAVASHPHVLHVESNGGTPPP